VGYDSAKMVNESRCFQTALYPHQQVSKRLRRRDVSTLEHQDTAVPRNVGNLFSDRALDTDLVLSITASRNNHYYYYYYYY